MASTSKNQYLGPGTYENRANFTAEARKQMSSTACFLNRKEENLFGIIEGLPAPTDYDTKVSDGNFVQKFWATSM